MAGVCFCRCYWTFAGQILDIETDVDDLRLIKIPRSPLMKTCLKKPRVQVHGEVYPRSSLEQWRKVLYFFMTWTRWKTHWSYWLSPQLHQSDPQSAWRQKSFWSLTTHPTAGACCLAFSCTTPCSLLACFWALSAHFSIASSLLPWKLFCSCSADVSGH